MSDIEKLKLNRLLSAVAQIDTEVSPEVELTASDIDPEEIRAILFSAWDDAVEGHHRNLTAGSMEPNNQELSDFDVLVLAAIRKAGENAYGVEVIEGVGEFLGREVSSGSVYVALDRLEANGLVSSWLGETTNERNGKPKRYYKVEGVGEKALCDTLKQKKRVVAASVEWGLT